MLDPAELDLDLEPNPVQFEVRTQSAGSRTGLRQLYPSSGKLPDKAYNLDSDYCTILINSSGTVTPDAPDKNVLSSGG